MFGLKYHRFRGTLDSSIAYYLHLQIDSQIVKTRRVSKVPFKVLDAPQLQDDFYLNLVDWSATNVLAVGLMGAVYIWSAQNSQV